MQHRSFAVSRILDTERWEDAVAGGNIRLKHKKPTSQRALRSEDTFRSHISWPVLPASVQPVSPRSDYSKPSMFLAASRDTSTPS